MRGPMPVKAIAVEDPMMWLPVASATLSVPPAAPSVMIEVKLKLPWTSVPPLSTSEVDVPSWAWTLISSAPPLITIGPVMVVVAVERNCKVPAPDLVKPPAPVLRGALKSSVPEL